MSAQPHTSTDTMPEETAAKHTPTPWKAEHCPVDHGYYKVTGTGEFEGDYVVETGADSLCDKANAELIVRAVNAHEELLEALKLVLDSLGALSNPSELDGRGLSDEQQAFILAAIDKAAAPSA